MSETSIFGLWTAVSGLAALVHHDRGERVFMWVWRVLFIVNAVLFLASIFLRSEAA